MKHYLHNSLRALFLSLAVLLSLPMLAVEVEIDGINYDLVAEAKQATVIVKSSDTYSGEIVIPESVEHEGSAYSVTSIGKRAFQNCYGLTSVTIPNSVTSIGDGAFWCCYGLTSVTIPNSVTSLGEMAFESCKGLTSVTIPNSVTSIGYATFCNCLSLTSVTIPNSVTSIGDEAFEKCSALTSVTIGNSVESIGRFAFRYCSGLTSVTIPNSVKSIGLLAFYDCNGMTSLTISNSVTTIEFGSFMYCSGLTSVTIPNSVTIIEEDAFGYCSGLTSVTIGDSVEEIGDEVFKNCTGLTSVTIPNSVKIIGERAFKDCTGLTSVTIGNSVRSIEDGAFYGCSKLLEVYCYAETMPSAFRNAFDSTPMANATLHVPAASIHVYKANTPWSGFGNIVALPNEFSLTVSSAGYAVLYLGFNAEIPEGVQAYTGVKVVGNSLKMKRVEGVLPANTGVVIRAEEGTYTFAESDATPAAIGDNLLYGTVTATQISTDPDYYYFVLSKVDGIVGMYLAELTDGKFLNNANTAYLAIAKKALGFSDDVEHLKRGFVFDFDEETGVDELKGENGTENSAVYDLSGRRVQKAQKGIYIQNGKVMVQ